MKNRKLSKAEIEARFAEINAQEAEEPSPEDLAAIAAAAAEAPDDEVSLEQYKERHEYSGKLLLRIPKELHKELAESARANGVSLNQYAMYKLSK